MMLKKYASTIVNKKTGCAAVQLVFTRTQIGLPICEVWAEENWLEEISQNLSLIHI